MPRAGRETPWFSRHRPSGRAASGNRREFCARYKAACPWARRNRGRPFPAPSERCVRRALRACRRHRRRFRPWEGTLEQADKPRVHGDLQFAILAHGACDIRKDVGEHQLIPDALLADDEDALALQIFAGPQRRLGVVQQAARNSGSWRISYSLKPSARRPMPIRQTLRECRLSRFSFVLGASASAAS